ncbi:MAG: hypothetical protein NTW14_10490 [bacterium]|nr:hypothetical protein [bacterium]
MSKKFWIAVVVSFVMLYALEFIFHAGILSKFYAARPDGFLSAEKMNSRMLWMPVGFFIWAFLWTYFFHRFASEKNVFRGIQHGVSYMIFLNVPKAFIHYASIDVSGYCYLWWTIGEVIMGVIIGAVMGAILKGEK